MSGPRQQPEDTGTYKPMMSNERVGRVRDWHERAYREARSRKPEKTAFLGRAFTIPSEVHSINPMSDLLGNAVLEEVKAGDRVLDMGTGCGVNAVLAASKSSDVVAVDINPYAVKATVKNAIANGVEGHLTIKESDVFDNVDGTFDLIVFDPPFRWFKPRDVYELGTADENYGALARFFDEVNDRLNENGRILLCFGSSGDLAYLHKLVTEAGLDTTVVAERGLEKDGLSVAYYTYLLRPCP